ncbi:uncharacterized protein LOC106158516 isoform X2 [Lingula anatina]|nr:uncharacterized protein LOC106158516 isoform X2 [Lingula anatina]|eukprot:XP_013389996.1 uncharacterized protein LOC106158516 isoform X2 [Lingula anatina]
MHMQLWWCYSLIAFLVIVIFIAMVLAYLLKIQPCNAKKTWRPQVTERPTFAVVPRTLHYEVPDRPIDTCDLACICQSRETKDRVKTTLLPQIIERLPSLTSKTIITTKVMVEEAHLIPRAMVYLVFIDWNTRGIIIESPNDPLQGSLGRRIVEAVKTRGGHLFVIYIGHRESRTLDTLYDERIQTTRTNDHLRPLASSDRFISMHRQFNELQLETLCQVFKDTFIL